MYRRNEQLQGTAGSGCGGADLDAAMEEEAAAEVDLQQVGGWVAGSE